ncbi:MAG TPA: type I-MYXAN CRISPR-associated protein Cas6/Cmx6 [Leucothrix mucor]|nr:type I-MYXAN CRISPR-associated protein Cas6/Cmx6 [Leucothrix mucor]
MFWQEDEDKTLPYEAPEDVIDISFNISCKQLPIDHAWELREQIQQALPWFKDCKSAGIHHIHVAESNNGWMRPDDENAVLYPSRRTRIYLRIPSEHLAETESLAGKELNIAEHILTLGKSKIKKLTNTSILFARHVLSDKTESEDDFLIRNAKEIEQLIGMPVKKMMSGKDHFIKTPNGNVHTRHLMIADLDTDSSIKIQQVGLGEERQLGCGIFLPHKGIKSLTAAE